MGRRAHVRLDDPLAPPRARLRRAHRLFRSHDPHRSWKRPAQANSSPIGVFKRTLTSLAKFQADAEFIATLVEALKYPTTAGKPTEALIQALHERFPNVRELDGSLANA